MSNFNLTSEEEKLLKDKNKTIVIRPAEDTEGIAKGEEVACNGMKLLVLDVRHYPTIKELIHLENHGWVAVVAVDRIEARSVLDERFSKEGGDAFCAIEFAPQD